jgi:hypothetical protein
MLTGEYSNWVGGEAVADALGVDGFDEAGFVDFETPDNIVHGQVKQAGNFAFIRVFESGHMVPFFKPLLALEMLRRAAEGRDFATGAEEGSDAFTEGPASSRYREGNATVQWVVVPETATYNTLTNMPNAWNTTARTAREKVRKRGPPKKIGIPSWLSRNRGR